MSAFNYRAEAELFPTKNRRSKSAPFAYRRFERAADAIRFAVEDLPADAFAGAYLEVGEVRFDRRGIREAGVVFAGPTYFYVASVAIVLAIGFYRLLSGDIPTPIAPPNCRVVSFTAERAFASGEALQCRAST